MSPGPRGGVLSEQLCGLGAVDSDRRRLVRQGVMKLTIFSLRSSAARATASTASASNGATTTTRKPPLAGELLQ